MPPRLPCPLQGDRPSEHPCPLPCPAVQGGGFGLLGRYLGLGFDNVVGLEMVLADGSIVQVDAGEAPGEGVSEDERCTSV